MPKVYLYFQTMLFFDVNVFHEKIFQIFQLQVKNVGGYKEFTSLRNESLLGNNDRYREGGDSLQGEYSISNLI